jgi:hypothetical protein
MWVNNAKNFKIIIPEGIGNFAGNGSRKASQEKQPDTCGTQGMGLCDLSSLEGRMTQEARDFSRG